MDLDIEQYNYVIPPHYEYSIRTIAGICTQLIDTPVTRSSLLFENRSLLELPPLTTSSPDVVHQQDNDESTTIPINKRRDISVYLENAPNNGIPNKLRGIPILFGITIISHLSSYLLDRIIPRHILRYMNKTSNPDYDDEGKQDEAKMNHRDKIINNGCNYCYSWSMHLYNKCKIQNLNVRIPNRHQIYDADGINPDNPAGFGVINGYKHNWNHNRLIRKILISSITSILTFPLYAIYTKIAFDIGVRKNTEIIIQRENENKHRDKENNIVDFKYNINAFCSNILSIGKQIIYAQGDNMVNTTKSDIFKLYNGYSIHLLYIILYQILIHYSREILIEISPKIHSWRIVNKYLSKKNDPFEYSMFCIWWIPPVICRVICYPLIKLQNRYIMGDQIVSMISNTKWRDNLLYGLKTMFHGVIGNTTRFMTEIQMAELFGLWSLIRFAHCEQYKLLIFEQSHRECAICYGDKGAADIVFVPCGHKFCKSDAYDVISRNMNCPTCMRPIQNSFNDLGKWKKLFFL